MPSRAQDDRSDSPPVPAGAARTATRRHGRRNAAVAILAVAALLAGCGEDGPAIPALPTALPTSLPSVDLPTPDVTVPTLPTQTTQPTEPPVTEPPVTEPPTTTPPEPPDATATPDATAEPVAAAEEDEGLPWWAWLLAALLLAAVMALLVLWNRRRSARAAWDARLASAVDDARWVEGSLVPDVLRARTADEASAVWTAGRPRVLAVDEELFALASDAPDEERAAYAALVQERLRALSSALDADVAAGAQADADRLRASRSAIDSARADLLTALDAPGAPGRPG